MKYYKITKNERVIKHSLRREEAERIFFPIIEDFSNGYIYDSENETIFNEVDKKIVATKGDESVRAGDDYFEILEEDEW